MKKKILSVSKVAGIIRIIVEKLSKLTIFLISILTKSLSVNILKNLHSLIFSNRLSYRAGFLRWFYFLCHIYCTSIFILSFISLKPTVSLRLVLILSSNFHVGLGTCALKFLASISRHHREFHVADQWCDSRVPSYLHCRKKNWGVLETQSSRILVTICTLRSQPSPHQRKHMLGSPTH
jgi:hypothetical protein